MGQHDVAGTVFRQCDGELGGVLVAQVTLKAQNALLQVIGIGTGAKGLYIVVEFQNRHVHAGQQIQRLVGDVAGVGEKAYAAALCIQPPAAGAGGVMGGGDGLYVDLPQSDSSLRLHEPGFDPRKPAVKFPAGPRRGKDGAIRLFQQGVQPGDVVGMGVSDEDGGQLHRGQPQFL